jgi:N-acetylmuramoyl-L-alanine amidase
MKILRHRLHGDDGKPFAFEPTPNQGEALTAEYLVIHYTAGRSARQSIDWFKNPAAKASAHAVIARDGTITQMVPFNLVAWHAGISSWEGRVGMNRYSIGIELDNAGRLRRQGDTWRAWFEDEYPAEDVIEAVHNHESQSCGWHVYTAAQIAAVLDLAILLMAHYGLRDILGHEDIAPGRKSDPGPAFPMENLRSKLLGRVADELPLYASTTNLNIRCGPGVQHSTLPGSPLPTGTRVEISSRQGEWCLVNVLGKKGAADLQGWVFGKYLRKIEN